MIIIFMKCFEIYDICGQELYFNLFVINLCIKISSYCKFFLVHELSQCTLSEIDSET